MWKNHSGWFRTYGTPNQLPGREKKKGSPNQAAKWNVFPPFFFFGVREIRLHGSKKNFFNRKSRIVAFVKIYFVNKNFQ